MSDFASVTIVYSIATVLGQLIVNVACAIGVSNMVDSLEDDYGDDATYILGRGFWVIATLVGGLITAGLFWLMHFSKMSPLYVDEINE